MLSKSQHPHTNGGELESRLPEFGCFPSTVHEQIMSIWQYILVFAQKLRIRSCFWHAFGDVSRTLNLLFGFTRDVLHSMPVASEGEIMMVQHGDESHGRIRKKSPTKTNPRSIIQKKNTHTHRWPTFPDLQHPIASHLLNWESLDHEWAHLLPCQDHSNMDVSKNSGTPKSSILIGFSIINHPFWGYPYFWKHPNSKKDMSKKRLKNSRWNPWVSCYG